MRLEAGISTPVSSTKLAPNLQNKMKIGLEPRFQSEAPFCLFNSSMPDLLEKKTGIGWHFVVSTMEARSGQNNLLTSAQRSAEVRALQRALSFGVCMSALCGLRFTDLDGLPFHGKQRFQFI